jgi:hypothetical protein
MEPLHKLFEKAQLLGILGKIANSYEAFRLSLYADVAAAIFIRPTEHDLLITNHIL